MSDERLIPSIPHRPDRPAESLLSEVPAEPILEGPGVGAESDAPADLEARVIEAIKTVYDPEIPVNIYELGLIYRISVQEQSRIEIAMTLTSPACPVAGSLPGEVETRVREVDGVSDASVELTWDPPWTPDKMSEEAKLMLNLPY